ncbi:amino acid racemase [Alloscardovia venturai]|uniref:Amino acid racemase n=1 Tax=Alloscardovia venturai TaxID=1769421 RepID=A0ABW2Y4J1_9BIFI
MRNFFTVLGGMGTTATESFIHGVNTRVEAHKDQDWPNYLVFNHASMPDRTAYITGESDVSPVPELLEDIRQADALGTDFIVLTCNTAHYFYDELQNATQKPILHMPHIAVEALAKLSRDNEPIHRVGLLATVGSMKAGVYEREITRAGYEFVAPEPQLQARITSLIYDDVKGNNGLNEARYIRVLHDMLYKHNLDAVILGCTELSVLNEHFPRPELNVIDAQLETIYKTIELSTASALASASR